MGGDLSVEVRGVVTGSLLTVVRKYFNRNKSALNIT